MVVGQELTIRSSDPTTHNVNIRSQHGPDQNFWMQRAGESSTTRFNRAEVVRSGCDVHPWMSAYIAVLDNPLFSITQSEGSFEIRNVPAGQYTLVAWHERYGRLTQPVAIAPDATSPISLDFTYQPPAAKP